MFHYKKSLVEDKSQDIYQRENENHILVKKLLYDQIKGKKSLNEHHIFSENRNTLSTIKI
jgi:hypothetical protein